MHKCYMWIPRVGVEGDDDFLPVFEVTGLPPGLSAGMRALLEDPDNGRVLVEIESNDPTFCPRLTADFPDLVHGDNPDGAQRPSKAARGRLRKVVDDARTRFNTDHAGELGVASRPELVEFDSG